MDFNEMLEPDLVLLSQTDIRIDYSGDSITLTEGLRVHIYMEDIGSDGQADNLIADGTAERNINDVSWGRVAKWCCRIDARGIRHESDT